MSESKRNEFKSKLLKLISDDSMPVEKEWEHPLPEFLPVVAKFVSSDDSRILTIEELPDLEFEFDYALRRTGLDFEQFDLLLRFKDACSKVEEVRDIYRSWFVVKASIDDMEGLLSDLI